MYTRIERRHHHPPSTLSPLFHARTVPSLRVFPVLSTNPSNKRDEKRRKKRNTTGIQDGWKREIELVHEAYHGRVAIILFLSRAFPRESQIERWNGREHDLWRSWCAVEQRLSPAEQSSSFLLDAQQDKTMLLPSFRFVDRFELAGDALRISYRDFLFNEQSKLNKFERKVPS